MAKEDVITFYRSMMAIMDITGCIGLFWYYLRRKRHPIKARKPWVVIAQSVAFLVTSNVMLLSAIGINDSLTCAPYLISVYVSAFFTMNIVVVRLFSLYFSGVWTEMAMKFEQRRKTLIMPSDENGPRYRPGSVIASEMEVVIETNINEAESAIDNMFSKIDFWILRHRYQLNLRNFLIVAFIFLLIFCIPLTYALGSQTQLFEVNPVVSECIRATYLLNICFVVCLAFISVLCWLISRRLRTIKENFRLIDEFKGTAAFTIFMVIFLALPNIHSYNNLIGRDWGMQAFLIAVLPQFFAQFVVIFRVIWWSYAGYRAKLKKIREKQSLSSTHGTTLTQDRSDDASRRFRLEMDFSDMLNDEEGSEIFRMFLSSEFSVENILFVNFAFEDNLTEYLKLVEICTTIQSIF